MSLITNVLIHGARDEAMAALNEWLREADDERHQQFERIDMGAAGGSKHYVVDVWAAAFNYTPHGLAEKLRDPETWGYGLLSVAVIFDHESRMEAFVFGGSEEEGWRPVIESER